MIKFFVSILPFFCPPTTKSLKPLRSLLKVSRKEALSVAIHSIQQVCIDYNETTNVCRQRIDTSSHREIIRTLLIDNYDSYTFNIWQALAEGNNREPVVVYNSNYEFLDYLVSTNFKDFDNVVISPGPGTVENPLDFGICKDIILKSPIPVMGVCLGHQGIAYVHGGTITKAPEPVHGRVWSVHHTGDGLFKGIEQNTKVVRYHSLIAVPNSSTPLRVTAWTHDGIVMGLEHPDKPLYGVQFHPESIGTVSGRKIFENFKDITASYKKSRKLSINQLRNASQFLFGSWKKTVETAMDNRKSASSSFEKRKRFVHISSILLKREDSSANFKFDSSSFLEYVYQHLFLNKTASFWLDSSSSGADKSATSQDDPTKPNFSFLGCLDTPTSYLIEYLGDNVLSKSFPSSGAKIGMSKNIFQYLKEQTEEQSNQWNVVIDSDSENNQQLQQQQQSTSDIIKEIAKGRVLFGYIGYEARLDASQILMRSEEMHARNSDVTSSNVEYNMSSTLDSNSSSSSRMSSTESGPIPTSFFLSPSRYLAYDHSHERLFVVSVEDEGSEGEIHHAAAAAASARYLEAQVRTAFDSYRSSSSPLPRPSLIQHTRTHVDKVLYSSITKTQYRRSIEKCLDHISDGDSYELCLTMKFSGPFRPESNEHSAASFDIYKNLRKHNPAPYSCFLNYRPIEESEQRSFSVCCSSPERYLKITRDGSIESKPIKGTARRDLVDAERDQELAIQLQTDEKSRAENLMIVDLVRNDLGRVCEIGSVHVPKLMSVETYSTVHQLVSTIRGKLSPRFSTADALVATFPGGSMTGAPKLRTMDLIESLEDHRPRGIYSGTIGYIGFDGTADLNIVIRTALIAQGNITVGAGGAIIAMSDPQTEVEEVMLKACAVSAAIGYNISFVDEF